MKKVQEKKKINLKYKFTIEVATIEKSITGKKIYFSEFAELKDLHFESAAAFKKFVDRLLKSTKLEKEK